MSLKKKLQLQRELPAVLARIANGTSTVRDANWVRRLARSVLA